MADRALFDASILTDYLKGVRPARSELTLCPAPLITALTWLDIMAGARAGSEQDVVRGFLDRFLVVPVTLELAERAERLRRDARLGVSQAVNCAAAEAEQVPLVTRDPSDYPTKAVDLRVPYAV